MWERACTIESAIGVLSRTSGSYNLIIFYELALSLVFCPFPALLFSWGAPSIITQPFFRVFSDMFEVLCSTPRSVFYHVRILTVVFLLNSLRVKWMKWYIWSPKSSNRRSIGFPKSQMNSVCKLCITATSWTEVQNL